MPSDRAFLERQLADVELVPFTLDDFHRRRHRKRRNRRIGATVLSLLLVAAVIGGVLQTESEGVTVASDGTSSTSGPSVTVPPAGAQDITDTDLEVVEPGMYFIDPDGDPSTPLRVTFEISAEGWKSWIGAAKFTGPEQVGLSITTVTNVVRDGCRDHSAAVPPVGPTVDDLATALTELVPFEVTSPPSDVTVLGYRGKHLQLTVPDLPVRGQANRREFAECTAGELHSWIAPNLGGSFYGYNAEPGRTEEFWILDVDGTRLVLETNQSSTSPPQDVAEMQAIFDSIRIET